MRTSLCTAVTLLTILAAIVVAQEPQIPKEPDSWMAENYNVQLWDAGSTDTGSTGSQGRRGSVNLYMNANTSLKRGLCANNTWLGGKFALAVNSRTASVLCNKLLYNEYGGLLLPRLGQRLLPTLGNAPMLQGLECPDGGGSVLSDCQSPLPSDSPCPASQQVGVVCPRFNSKADLTTVPTVGSLVTVYFYTSEPYAPPPDSEKSGNEALLEAVLQTVYNILQQLSSSSRLADSQLSLFQPAYMNFFSGPGLNANKSDSWHAVNFFFFETVEMDGYANRADLEYWTARLTEAPMDWLRYFSVPELFVLNITQVAAVDTLSTSVFTAPAPPTGFPPSSATPRPAGPGPVDPTICPGNCADGWNFKLVNGYSASSGTVMARPPGATQWGTLCGASFDNTPLVDAICATLGYPWNGGSSPRPIWFPPTVQASIFTPIYAAGPYTCTSASIQSCAFVPYNESGVPGACRHVEDLSVDCSPPASASASGAYNYPARSFTAFMTFPYIYQTSMFMMFEMERLIQRMLGLQYGRVKVSIASETYASPSGTGNATTGDAVIAFEITDDLSHHFMQEREPFLGEDTPSAGSHHHGSSGFPHFPGSGFPSGFPSGSSFPYHSGSGFPYHSGSGFPFPPPEGSSSSSDASPQPALRFNFSSYPANVIGEILIRLHPLFLLNAGIEELRANTTAVTGAGLPNTTQWGWRVDGTDFPDVPMNAAAAGGIGRVVVQPGSRAPNGTVCSNGTGVGVASQLCSLALPAANLPNRVARHIPYYRFGSGPIYVSALQSVAPPTNLVFSNGMVRNNTCVRMEALGVLCGEGLRDDLLAGTSFVAVIFGRHFETPNATLACLARMTNTPFARYSAAGYVDTDPLQVLVYFSIATGATAASPLTSGDIALVINATDTTALFHGCGVQAIRQTTAPPPPDILTQNPTAAPITTREPTTLVPGQTARPSTLAPSLAPPTTARPSTAAQPPTTPSPTSTATARVTTAMPSLAPGETRAPTSARPPTVAPGQTAVPPPPTTAAPSLAPGQTAVPTAPTTAAPSLAPGQTAVPTAPTTAAPSLAPGQTAVPSAPATSVPSLAPGQTAVPTPPTTAVPSMAPGQTARPSTSIPTTRAPPTPQPTAPPTQVQYTVTNASAVNETVLLTTLASLLGIPRSSLSIASKTATGIVVQFANNSVAEKAASNATLSDLKVSFPAITGAAAVSAPLAGPAASSSNIGLIVGVVVGAVVLIAVVSYVVKSRGSGGSGSSQRDSYDNGKEGIVQLDQMFTDIVLLAKLDADHRRV